MKQVLTLAHQTRDSDLCLQHMLQDLKALSSGGRTPGLCTDWMQKKAGGARPELGSREAQAYVGRVGLGRGCLAGGCCLISLSQGRE